MDRHLNVFDEGLVLVNAIRTLHGDVVHHDFYSPYGPGSYYILGMLFRIDSHWFILGRFYGLVTMAGIVAISFGLLIGRTRFGVALAFTAVTGIWLLSNPSYLYPLFPSVLLALIGSALLLAWFERDRWWRVLLAGMSAGSTALFRYDAGFFLASAHVAALAVGVCVVGRPERPRFAELSRLSLIYAAGAAVSFLSFAFYYLHLGSISGFIADIIDYPVYHYAANRGLPFPQPLALLHDPENLGVYLPIVTVLVGAFKLVRIERESRPYSGRRKDPDQVFLIVFLPLAAILYYKGVVRVSPLHMLMSILPSTLVLAIVVDRMWRRSSFGRMSATLLFGMVVILAVAASRHSGVSKLAETLLDAAIAALGTSGSDTSDRSPCPPNPATMYALLQPDYWKASEYVRQATSPDEKISSR